jgi:hypothetical protein
MVVKRIIIIIPNYDTVDRDEGDDLTIMPKQHNYTTTKTRTSFVSNALDSSLVTIVGVIVVVFSTSLLFRLHSSYSIDFCALHLSSHVTPTPANASRLLHNDSDKRAFQRTGVLSFI